MFVTCSLSWTQTPLVDNLACFTERKQNTGSTFFFAVWSVHILSPLGGFWYLEFLEKKVMESTQPPSCLWWKKHQVCVSVCLCENLLWCSGAVGHVFLHQHVSPRLVLQSWKWLIVKLSMKLSLLSDTCTCTVAYYTLFGLCTLCLWYFIRYRFIGSGVYSSQHTLYGIESLL